MTATTIDVKLSEPSLIPFIDFVDSNIEMTLLGKQTNNTIDVKLSEPSLIPFIDFVDSNTEMTLLGKQTNKIETI